MFKFMGYVALAALTWVIWKNGIGLPFVQEYRPPTSIENKVSRTKAKMVRVKVSAARDTIYGEPWDGSNSVGGVMGPIYASLGLSSPPDLTVCVVSETLAVKCATESYKQEQVSSCVDAFQCAWQVSVPTDQPYALVVFDMDNGLFEGAWDFVDAVYVSNSKDSNNLQQLDRLTRRFIEKTAPTAIKRPDFVPKGAPIAYAKEEALRRMKSFYFLSLKELSAGISLAQSDIVVVSN